jgi:hypothetical protein
LTRFCFDLTSDHSPVLANGVLGSEGGG